LANWTRRLLWKRGDCKKTACWKSNSEEGGNDLTYSAKLHQSNVKFRMFGIQGTGMAEGFYGLKIFLFGLL
jgi:hypothetical protein